VPVTSSQGGSDVAGLRRSQNCAALPSTPKTRYRSIEASERRVSVVLGSHDVTLTRSSVQTKWVISGSKPLNHTEEYDDV
jgi:hypothetical protein